MSLLVITQPRQRTNTYGRYLVEVLKADGFAAIDVLTLGGDDPDDVAAWGRRGLAPYDAVVVTTMLATKAQAAALAAYARTGGRLVVLRPSRLLAAALGLVPSGTVVYPAYVQANANHSVGAGVPHTPIQTHVPADQYDIRRLPPGTAEVARLFGSATSATSFSAVLDVPTGDGRAVVFSYDLARAVALIRQGNPLLADWRGSGFGDTYRASDLFVGHVDPACEHLPQADIHGMLLGNAINLVACRPQPRWWYYPTPDVRSAVVLDSDDDWSTEEHFEALLGSVERHGGHISVYLMLGPTRSTIATPEKVAAWRERGHSFGIHHNPFDPAFADEEQAETMEGIVRRDVASFRTQYGDVPLANRNHADAWLGYVDLARLYAELGVTMDLNVFTPFHYWQSYLNGSGRPMRFVDLDGTVTDCFQQLTQIHDSASVRQRLTMDPMGEAARTRSIMEEKVTTYFSPISMLSHPVSFFSYSSGYMNRCWEHARELGMPLWSAFEWAAFTRARDTARIADVAWDDGHFACRVSGQSPQGSLTLMVPLGGRAVEHAAVDGQPVVVATQQAFGWTYALVRVPVDSQGVTTRDVSVAFHGEPADTAGGAGSATSAARAARGADGA